MNRTGRLLCALMTCIILLAVCPAQALAAEPIDPTKDSSMTVIYQYDDTPLTGVRFNVFRIASVDDHTQFALEERFADYPVRVNDNTVEGWNELAATLTAYIQAYGTAPDYSEVTDENGTVELTGLKPGLYLVVGEKLVTEFYTYTVQPTIVAIPSLDFEANAWLYDVECYPKARRDAIPDEPSTVKRKVLKIWDDDGNTEKRPENITVQLYADGKPYGEPVKLDAKCYWKYTWENLPEFDAKGGRIVWSVTEAKVDGYTVKIDQSGMTFTVKNSTGKPPVTPPDKPPVLPQTGVLWWPVPLLTCVGLALIIAGIVRRRRNA